ncbi:MAG: type II secretion system protein N [Rubrivivax sp.]|nr:type II secretion system protein N [Rubrivivax sp.]
MKRWMLAGSALGALLALVAFAPAAWLARGVSAGTEGRLLLADARGTVWQGSAVLVLTGGPGSRDASALPGRLHWTLGLAGSALSLGLQQACCIAQELRLRLVPGLGRLRIELPGAGDGAALGSAVAPRVLGQWPASWLVGLGTPWNTLKPAGTLQLSSAGLVAEAVQGRWIMQGQAELQLRGMSSSLSTLEELGSYRLDLQGDPRGDAARVQLNTTDGALQLSGSGDWAASGLRFRGQASAAPGSEAALSNLLNIIGRRQGALSLISIG